VAATFVARTLAPRALAREDTHAAVVAERLDASIAVVRARRVVTTSRRGEARRDEATA
jgi:hypothetical protein